MQLLNVTKYMLLHKNSTRVSRQYTLCTEIASIANISYTRYP